jgi:hypothetical protein
MFGSLRTLFIVAMAAVLGFVVTAGVLTLILASGDDDEGDGEQARTTERPGTPETQPAPQETAGPTEPTDRTDLRNALAALVRDELDAEYLGVCPITQAPGQELDGICSVELHRGVELASFALGPPFSEGIGEAVFLRDEAGEWAGEFFRVGTGEIAVGAEAIVYGAGDCLRFRFAPAAEAEVITCQLDGTTAVVLEGPVETGGVRWWRLEGLGWASAEFLAPAP